MTDVTVGPSHDAVPSECPKCGKPVSTVEVHGISPEDVQFDCGCPVPSAVYRALAESHGKDDERGEDGGDGA